MEATTTKFTKHGGNNRNSLVKSRNAARRALRAEHEIEVIVKEKNDKGELVDVKRPKMVKKYPEYAFQSLNYWPVPSESEVKNPTPKMVPLAIVTIVGEG